LYAAGTYQTSDFAVNQRFVLKANGERTAEVNWIGTEPFSECGRWNMLWTLGQEKQPWNLAETPMIVERV
jgi:hypothetical protein